MALPHPDWLYQELTVTGEVDALWSFQRAAAGAGVVPWVFDYDRLEEHWLALMLAQPGQTISLRGAKIVAREARDAMREEHDEAAAWVGRSRACPLDLHALVPVPWEVLRLGPDAPASMRWMWENWGTTWPLRKVERLPCPAGWRVGFWGPPTGRPGPWSPCAGRAGPPSISGCGSSTPPIEVRAPGRGGVPAGTRPMGTSA